MNRLECVEQTYAYEIDGEVRHATQGEFVVDGVPLGETLRLEEGRPWFGVTCLDDPEAHRVLMLRGLAPPRTQLGTPRPIHYGCHCGCDYCGVISAEVIREEDQVRWRDIRYQDDDPESEPPWPARIPELVFSLPEYDQALASYRDRQKSAENRSERLR